MSEDSDEKTAFRAGLQNFLGGMVLLALPAVPGFMYVSWSAIDDMADEQREHALQLKGMERRITRDYLDFKEALEKVQARYDAQLLRLQAWKEETSGNRFRKEDGERLSSRIDRIEKSQIEHDKEAQRWMEVIRYQGEALQELRKKGVKR